MKPLILMFASVIVNSEKKGIVLVITVFDIKTQAAALCALNCVSEPDSYKTINGLIFHGFPNIRLTE